MKSFIAVFLSVLFLGFIQAHGDSFIRLKNLEINTTTLGPIYAMDGAGKVKGKRFQQVNGKQYYIVQFSGPVVQKWKDSLVAQGVELSSYIPDNAFLSKIDSPKAWQAVNESKNVKAVIPYEVEYRVSEELATPSVFNKDERLLAMVQIISPLFMPEFLAKLKELGISAAEVSEKSVYVDSTVEKVREITRIEGVEWVEPAPIFETMDFDALGWKDWFKKKPKKPNPEKPPGGGQPDPHEPIGEAEKMEGNYKDLSGYESGTKLMNFEAAWDKGLSGEGEIVGVVDSGLDLGSTQNILDDFKNQVVKGYARGLGSKSWEDPQGHGTHTAGSVVGTGAASGGLLKGGAYSAKLVEQSLWSKSLNNLLMLPMNFKLLFEEPHRQDGVSIHSNSWGSISNAYDIPASNVDTVMWNNPELLLVFASGNSGQDMDKDGHIDTGSVGSPSTAKNCLTVGASENLITRGGIQKVMSKLKGGDKKWAAEPIASSKLSDNPNGIAPFSSIGPTKDGRIKPDIVAPGTNIVSTRSQHKKASKLWGEYNQYYTFAGGTSMSTPLTAGAAVVTRQYLKTISKGNPSSSLIKAVMIHNAHDLFPGQYGEGSQQEFQVRRPNPQEGFGRVDMASVVTPNYFYMDERAGVKTGEQKTYSLGLEKVTAGQKMRVTMVYNDAPGATSAKGSLVNDLDLQVVDSKGTVYHPNHLNEPDRKNNVEMVEFDAPVSGTYSIVVKGTNVPQNYKEGGQPYSIVWQYK